MKSWFSTVIEAFSLRPAAAQPAVTAPGWTLAAVATVLLVSVAPVRAAEPEVTVTIKDHRFMPEEVGVPAGVRLKLIVRNEDPTPEEFESYELNREKIVAGNGQITVYVGPLKAGTYPFFGEFNPKTAQGRVVAK